jgi:hypothetical protein
MDCRPFLYTKPNNSKSTTNNQHNSHNPHKFIIMVSFHKIFLASLAMVAPIVAQTTPEQVVTNLKMITQKSQALQAPAQSITIINGPLIIIGQGPFPQIIAGFTDIVATGTTALAQMQGMSPVPAGDKSDAIFDAFREVSEIHLSSKKPLNEISSFVYTKSF